MDNLPEKRLIDQLDALSIDTLARTCGLESAYTKKIHARDFLLSFLMLYNNGFNTLENWAAQIALLCGELVSKQAVSLHFDDRHVAFFTHTCEALLARRCCQQAAVGAMPLFASFPRVLLEDSTCFSVHSRLASCFPSSFSKQGDAATARLQLVYDLKAEHFVSFDLQAYRDNDQKHAPCILEHAETGDLLIRDLGYFSLAVLRKLHHRGVSFLSRLRYRVQVLDPKTRQAIDLVEYVKQPRLQQQGYMDEKVLLGAQEQFELRLVGVRLCEEHAAERRRKAKQDRHTRSRHNEHYLAWLSWQFFITNVEGSVWSPDHVQAAYRLRWRIEILFKSMKGSFHTAEMLKDHMLSYNRVVMTLTGMLIYWLLVVQPWYRYFEGRLGCGRLSLIKFSMWVRLNLVQILLRGDLGCYTNMVERYCSYGKYRKRKNFGQLLMADLFP